MNIEQMTQKTREALQAAQRIAVEYSNNAVEQEHLLAALAQRCENVEEDMAVLKSVMDTNLSFEELAYLMYFLRGVDFSNVPSLCLPGTIIEIEGREYFQVDEASKQAPQVKF